MTRIVCHRGACRLAPENTLASARKAVAEGGDIIELDIRDSADGVPYVIHDALLDRTTNGRGYIAETDSAVLDTLDAGSWFAADHVGEPVPRLAHFLWTMREEAGFYLEFKHSDPVVVGDILTRLDLRDQVFTYSESAVQRAAIAEALPWIKRMVNWRDIEDCATARAQGYQIIEFHAPDVSSERLAAARGNDLEIMIYTPLQDERVFAAAISEKVEYMNTDYPAAVKQIRDRKP